MKNDLLRIATLALLLYALVSFYRALRTLDAVTAARTELQQEVAELESENAALRGSLENDISDGEIQALARQRLGLVMPGEKIFYFKSDGE